LRRTEWAVTPWGGIAVLVQFLQKSGFPEAAVLVLFNLLVEFLLDVVDTNSQARQ